MAALSVLETVLEAAQSLEDLGQRGRELPELRTPAIRELLSNPFRIVYRVQDEVIEILGLLHQRRDFRLWERSKPAES